MVRLLCVLLLAVPPALPAAPDLARRQILQPLYAGDPDAALARALELQAGGDWRPADDEDRLLLATLHRRAGLTREARRLLRPLARGDGPLAARARVHLAELEAGRPERVLALLEDLRPPPDLADRAAHLRLQALIRSGRLEEARAALDGAPPRARAYARYNLAAAWQRAGETKRARRQLRMLVRQGRADDPVLGALADEARLGLAYLDLADGRPRRAVRVLADVRRDGPQAPRALLGLGWAWLRAERPQAALAPLALLAREDAGLAAGEGRLALAHAYERLGRREAALAAYQATAERAGAHLEELRGRLARLRSAGLPAAYLAPPEALARDPEGRALHRALDEGEVQAAYRALLRAGERQRRLAAARARLAALMATARAQRARHLPRLQALRADRARIQNRLRHLRRQALARPRLTLGAPAPEPALALRRRLEAADARLQRLERRLAGPPLAPLQARLEDLERDLGAARRAAEARLVRALERVWGEEERRLRAWRDQARYALARLLDPGAGG